LFADKIKDSNDIPPWDRDFLKIEKEMLFGIANASIDLDIKGLSVVTSRAT